MKWWKKIHKSQVESYVTSRDQKAFTSDQTRYWQIGRIDGLLKDNTKGRQSRRNFVKFNDVEKFSKVDLIITDDV